MTLYILPKLYIITKIFPKTSIIRHYSYHHRWLSSFSDSPECKDTSDYYKVARAIVGNKYRGSVIIQANGGRNAVTECLMQLSGVEDYVIVGKRNKDTDCLVALSMGKDIRVVNHEQNIKIKDNIPVTFLQWVMQNKWDTSRQRINSLFRDNLQDRDVEIFLLASALVTQSIVRKSSSRPEESQSGNVRYSNNSILCSLAYNTKILMQMPISSLGKVITIKPRKHRFIESTIQGFQIQEDSVYLLHLRVKQDFIKNFSPSLARTFSIFLRKTRRKGPIITVLDDLITDCGLKLIDMGFTYNDNATTLSPDEYLQIFKEMRKWDGYEDSQLKPFMMEDKFDDTDSRY